MKQGVSKSLYWTPRVLSIMLLLFLAMFSLDVIEEGLNFWQIALGLFMHNMPVFVLAIFLWIAWKHEWVGGVVFILAGLLYVIITAMRVPWYIAVSWGLTIAGPAFLIGILFMVNWAKKKKIRLGCR